MLIAGIAACCLGALEFFMDTRLFSAVFAGNYKKAALLIFAKLAVYALCIWVLLAFFRDYVPGAGIGFGIGFLIYLIFYAVRFAGKKDG